MRRLLPFIAATVTVLAVPTAADAQEGCPIGQYLVQTGPESRDDDVACLQSALNAAGYDSGPTDSWFGPVTRSAVTRYQQDHGLVVDGEVGAQTAGRLGLWQPEARTTPPAASTGTNRTAQPSGGGGTGKWAPIIACESGGQWDYNGSSGFDGALQFAPSTWRGFGGTQYAEYAWQATQAEQIAVAERVLAGQGWGAWPTCARQAGYR